MAHDLGGQRTHRPRRHDRALDALRRVGDVRSLRCRCPVAMRAARWLRAVMIGVEPTNSGPPVKLHRALFRVTGGRRGLWPARAERWGALRLTTIGRRTGQERSVILGYIEDGPNLVTWR